MRLAYKLVVCLLILLAAKPVFADEPIFAPIPSGTGDGIFSAPPAGSPLVAQPDAVIEPVAEPEGAPGEEVTPPVLSILSAVARGKELLAPVLADFKTKEAHVEPLLSKNGLTAAALAVWDKKTDAVFVIGGTRGANYFTPDDGRPAVPIVVHAGSQTAYRDADPDSVVVGTVQGDMVAVTYKKKKMYAPRFSYYAPYNQELYSTETLAAGSDYLSNLIQDSFNDLDAKGITSRAFPGQALTAIIDPYLIKSIAVIEHADGQIYDNDNSENSLGRFLIKLALNKEDALDSALSVAGARGMVQFIPSTYKLMVTRRPDLGLIPDFVKGMADHRNSIMAEAAYLDMILVDLPQSVRDLYRENRGVAAEYMAAGYNGGSTRVKKAILAWGEAWDNAHSKNSLRKETIAYVVKLRRVYDLLAAGCFATPNAPANTMPVARAASDPATGAFLLAAASTSTPNP